MVISLYNIDQKFKKFRALPRRQRRWIRDTGSQFRVVNFFLPIFFISRASSIVLVAESSCLISCEFVKGSWIRKSYWWETRARDNGEGRRRRRSNSPVKVCFFQLLLVMLSIFEIKLRRPFVSTFLSLTFSNMRN